MSRNRWLRAAGILAVAGSSLLAGTGCRREAPPATPPAQSGTPPPAGGGNGTLRGEVLFRGPVPARETIPVHQAADRTVCGTEQVSEALRIGPHGELRDAVVILEDPPPGRPAVAVPPASAVSIRNCRFEPHTLLLPRGTPVVFRNEDRIRHRIRGMGADGRTLFEVTLPRRGVQITRALDAPPRILLGGEDRPWMSGTVWIAPHPYAGVTDDEGRFRLIGIPPGTYTLRAWHPALGETTARVEVRPVEETVVRLSLPPGA